MYSKELIKILKKYEDKINAGKLNYVYRETPKNLRNQLLELFKKIDATAPKGEFEKMERELYGIKSPGHTLSVRTPAKDGAVRCGFTQNQGMQRAAHIVFDDKQIALDFCASLNIDGARVYEMSDIMYDKIWVPVYIYNIKENYKAPGFINQMHFDKWQNRLQKR